MSDIDLFSEGGSPFDAIRRDGDRWSARDLMPLMGYARWENFETPVRRAMKTAENQGMDVETLFLRSQEKTAGRPREDFELSRYAAYLIAMNGDPNIPEVAAAQHYFAVRTRQAETASRALPTKKELAQWVVEAEERAERAEAQVRELAVPASAWNELAEAAGDYAVGDAAKVLMRDPNITNLGERRLFAFMASIAWVFRRDGRWRAYQSQVDRGRLTEKVGRPYVRNGVMHNGDPTVRITPKGLAELHKLLGGSQQLALMAVAE